MSGLMGVLGIVVALAGCWPAPGQGPDRRSHNALESAITPATVDQLSTKWTASADPTGGEVGDPIVSDVAVHFSDGLNLYGINRATGVRLWLKPAGPEGAPVFMGQPFADGRRLLVGNGFPNLGGHWDTIWVDAATGQTQSSVAGGLVAGLRGSTVLTDSHGFGTNTPIGKFISLVHLDAPGTGWGGTIDVASSGSPFAPPMTLGTARAYQGGPGTMLPVVSNPTRGNGVRAFPVSPAPAPCPAPATFFLCPAWSTAIDGSNATSPVLDEGETTVYVGSNAGTLYALDTATGAIKWTAAVGAGVTDSPALADGRLYVPTADGDLVVLAAGGCGNATCSPLWTGTTGGPIRVQPAVAGGVVFTGSADADGTVTAFDAAGCGAATCDSLWETGTGSAVTGAPAVSAGRLYVGTEDGFLYAFGLP